MAHKITATFTSDFQGELHATRAQAAIGRSEGELLPYDMLLGALASCYYATFVDIMKKKRVAYDRCEIQVSGVKRDEIPTTLETCDLSITIHGAADEKGFAQAADLAAKYCSIYQTIAQVAEMSYTLSFA